MFSRNNNYTVCIKQETQTASTINSLPTAAYFSYFVRLQQKWHSLRHFVRRELQAISFKKYYNQTTTEKLVICQFDKKSLFHKSFFINKLFKSIKNVNILYIRVQRLLGHADLQMATRYVQDVSAQTDRVIENSRMYICKINR
jgi:hypothetical protein